MEYPKPEGGVAVERTFHTKLGAKLALVRIEKENPGVVYTIRKHVDFESKS